MQHATPDGLKPAVGTRNERHHVVCTQNAASQVELCTSLLVDQWSSKTPQQAHAFLSSPDVTVTNQGDKDVQLPKIKKLNETVQIAFRQIDAQLERGVVASLEAVAIAEEELSAWERENDAKAGEGNRFAVKRRQAVAAVAAARAAREDHAAELHWDELAAVRCQLLEAITKSVSEAELRAILHGTEGHRSAKDAQNLANSLTPTAPQRSALFLATANRSPALVRVLVQAGADVGCGRPDEGTTPMHLAAGWLHSEAIVEALLAAPDAQAVAESLRVKPNSGGLKQHTPVFWADHYSRPSTKQRLVAWMRSVGWLYHEESDSFER